MQRIFLDTSIISAYFDPMKPVRQIITQKWVQNDLGHFDGYISNLVIEEIENTRDDILKENMLELVESHTLKILDVNLEIQTLASQYRTKIIPNEMNDSIHIATATCNRLKAIASWNFKHIVNLNTIDAIHTVNKTNGYDIIEILTIQELGGNKYGIL